MQDGSCENHSNAARVIKRHPSTPSSLLDEQGFLPGQDVMVVKRRMPSPVASVTFPLVGPVVFYHGEQDCGQCFERSFRKPALLLTVTSVKRLQVVPNIS
ncbi:hypothetical protein BaRGS_00001211 [Batillaria attramentaria]|uniref:Uncharacterized protein n=1 Tax=Batillaria attramentaria TaxID=370345 RepID=A0ABD0M761_9CAEN